MAGRGSRRMSDRVARSVYVDGEVLTWTALAGRIPDARKFSPFLFDKARDLPLVDAQRLYAWLRRRGIDAELRAPGASAQSGERPRRVNRRPPEKGWSV